MTKKKGPPRGDGNVDDGSQRPVGRTTGRLRKKTPKAAQQQAAVTEEDASSKGGKKRLQGSGKSSGNGKRTASATTMSPQAASATTRGRKLAKVDPDNCTANFALKGGALQASQSVIAPTAGCSLRSNVVDDIFPGGGRGLLGGEDPAAFREGLHPERRLFDSADSDTFGNSNIPSQAGLRIQLGGLKAHDHREEPVLEEVPKNPSKVAEVGKVTAVANRGVQAGLAPQVPLYKKKLPASSVFQVQVASERSPVEEDEEESARFDMNEALNWENDGESPNSRNVTASRRDENDTGGVAEAPSRQDSVYPTPTRRTTVANLGSAVLEGLHREELTPKSKTINSLKNTLEDEKTQRRVLTYMSDELIQENKNLKKTITAMSTTADAMEAEIDELRKASRSSAAENGDVGGGKQRQRKSSSKGSSAAMKKANVESLRVQVRREVEHGGSNVSRVKRNIFEYLIQRIPGKIALAVQSLSFQDGILQHVWYPQPLRLKGENGNGTIPIQASSAESSPQEAVSQESEVPENPLLAATRPPNGGGLFTVPELVDAGGVNGTTCVEKLLKRWAFECYRDATSGPAADECGSDGSEDVTSACQLLARESTLISLVKDSLSRKASDWKRSFTKRLLELCFPEYFSLPVKRQKSQEVVANQHASSPAVECKLRFVHINQAVNIALGGSTVDFSSPDGISYTDWAKGRSKEVYLFGAWRRLETSGLQSSFELNLSEVMASRCNEGRSGSHEEGASEHGSEPSDLKTAIEKLVDEAAKGYGRVQEDNWTARDMPCPIYDKEGGDLLFRNSHAARSFPIFFGRGDSSSPEFVEGRSSILGMARADAWIAASLSLSQSTSGSGVTGSGGMFNSKFNELFSELLPHATYSLLDEIRGHVEKVSVASEFKKPFNPSEAKRIVQEHRSRPLSSEDKDGDEPSGPAGGGTPVSQSTVNGTNLQQPMGANNTTPPSITRAPGSGNLDAVRRQRARALAEELDKVSDIPYATHTGNPYCNSYRKATVSFHNAEEKKDYLVVRPSFFKKEICGWIGDVCDVYIGQCNPGGYAYDAMPPPSMSS